MTLYRVRKHKTMTQTYFNPDRVDEPYALPDCEIFHMEDSEARESLANYGDDIDDDQDYSGWYWWACFPGCLPDGDPMGPHETYLDALIDARSANDLYETEMIDSHAESWHYETKPPTMKVWYLWKDAGYLLQVSDTIPQNAPSMISYLVTYSDVTEDQILDYVRGKALKWFYNAT